LEGGFGTGAYIDRIRHYVKEIYGAAGEETLMPIPIMPDGTMDQNYDMSGKLKKDRKKDPKSIIPGHGEIYATALLLSGINPKGRGRNDRDPLNFVKRT